MSGRVPKTPLVGWLVALPQVELDTTLADVSRIPLNNAHNVSLANCKRQMTSSLVQCAGCRCLDRRPVSRTSLPKRRPTLRSKFHVCFLRLHGHLRACLSSHAIARPGWRAMAVKPWWRRLACPLCESLSWLFQEVICILQCCC